MASKKGNKVLRQFTIDPKTAQQLDDFTISHARLNKSMVAEIALDHLFGLDKDAQSKIIGAYFLRKGQ